MGHTNSIITVDVYTDKKVIIEDWVENIQAFIDEVHPYSDEDKRLLKRISGTDCSQEKAV